MQIQSSIELDIDAATAFAFVADAENNPTWQDGMERCKWTSEPPIQLGSTYDQQARFMGRPILTQFEVVVFEPGHRIRIESLPGSTFPIQVERLVEPLGTDRCRVTATVSGGPGGLMRLFDPLMARMVRRSVDADYARLKRLLERENAE